MWYTRTLQRDGFTCWDCGRALSIDEPVLIDPDGRAYGYRGCADADRQITFHRLDRVEIRVCQSCDTEYTYNDQLSCPVCGAKE